MDDCTKEYSTWDGTWYFSDSTEYDVSVLGTMCLYSYSNIDWIPIGLDERIDCSWLPNVPISSASNLHRKFLDSKSLLYNLNFPSFFGILMWWINGVGYLNRTERVNTPGTELEQRIRNATFCWRCDWVNNRSAVFVDINPWKKGSLQLSI